MSRFPFKQRKSGSILIREFSASVASSELVWHRDREDRVITVTESRGWLLQRDNDVPVEMKPGDQFFIPALEWHRVIKGAGKLLIEVDTDAAHPGQYGASQGSKRDKQLDQTKKDLEKAKELKKQGKAGEAQELEQKAYRRRDRMERQEREKNESHDLLKKYIKELLVSEDCNLSKTVKKTLKKKAEERGFTVGSVEKEYCAGLGAYNTSGSRPGMTPQQWAYARVNSASPSKDWAVVKKSKAKKKKKK